MVSKKLIPAPFRKIRRILRDRKRDAVFQNLSIRDTFEKIYREHLWGVSSERGMYSGQGSHLGRIIEPYTDSIDTFLGQHQDISTAADLGCGDFNIGVQLFEKFTTYHAIDIVPEVIRRNRLAHRDERLHFQCADITNDALPGADIAFVRQVLQHLSNADIQRFLENIEGKYRYLVVTESLHASRRFRPNRDIVTGPGVRIHQKSGVVLTAAPFELKVIWGRVICDVSLGRERVLTMAYRLA